MGDESDEVEQLPPRSVPANCCIHFLTMSKDGEWNRCFRTTLQELILEVSRFIDLDLLDGVTVSFDYDEALGSVELGYESERARRYTNEQGLIGVGKTLRVLRDGALKVHVVLNASCLTHLADYRPDNDEFWAAANIVAHELAHVEVTSWYHKHSPNEFLTEVKGDWATACLRDAAHTIWEEYAACLLSAQFSRGDGITASMVSSLETSIDGAISKAHEAIKRYRLHSDVGRLFAEVGPPVTMPLKMAAYLLGHLDGLDQPFDLTTLSREIACSDFGPLVTELQKALRSVWAMRSEHSGMKSFDDIVGVIVQSMASAGAVVTLSSDPGQTRIDVPFTAETMPNGEHDMIILRMTEQLRYYREL